MDTSSLETVAVYECISSEGATANPLKVGFLLSYADWVSVFFLLQRRSFRRPMELPVVNEDPRKVRVEHNKKYLPKFDPSKTTKCQNQIKSFSTA